MTKLYACIRSKNWIRYALAIFVPIIIMFILILYRKENFFHFVPGTSDEIDYWMEIRAIVENGLFSNSGYFGYQELTANYLFYGAHGPYLLLPYYLIGKIIGWNTYTPLICNVLFMIIALLLFAAITKSNRMTGLLCILLCGYSYFTIFYMTAMVETLFFAIAIVMGALFYKCFSDPEASKKYKIWLFVLISISALFRISNVLFFFPYLFLLQVKKKSHYIYIIAGGFIYMFLLYLMTSMFSVAYPNGFLYKLMQAVQTEGIGEGAVMILKNIYKNIGNFLNPGFGGYPNVFMRYVMMFSGIAYTFFAFFRLKDGKVRKREKLDWISFSNALTLLLIVILVFTFYDVYSWRDTRTFAPVLFTTFVLTILHVKISISLRTAVVTASIVSIIFVNHTLNYTASSFPKNKEDFTMLNDHIRYDAEAESRWENTVLINNFPVYLTNMEPGISFMYYYGILPIEQPLKSKYAFFKGEFQDDQFVLIETDGTYYLYCNKAYLENQSR